MTLTELSVAAAIMATTFAVATPSLFRAKDAYILHSAARMVESRMHSARINAVTRNKDCRINVLTSSTYVVECQDASWNVIETIALPPGITATASARPEFHQRGNVAPTATITVWNSQGQNLRVIVNINGRVRIQ